MPPRGRPLRIVRRIGNQERALIHDHYMRNGPVWDLVINDMIRDNRFQNVPANVHAGSLSKCHSTATGAAQNSRVYNKRTKEVSITPLFFTCHIPCMPCMVSFAN